MKIAIISFGHEASSLPLGKALVLKGHFVDFYFDVHFGHKFSVEGTKLQLHSLNGFLGNVPSSMLIPLQKWIGMEKINFKYINTFGQAKSKPLLCSLFTFLRKCQIRVICKKLNTLKYDVVYLVGRYMGTEDIVTYCKSLSSEVVVGLHEVCNHFNPDFKNPSPVLKHLFFNDVQIVVFSQNSLGDIKKYEDCNPDKVSLIHFGIFDTYPTCISRQSLFLPEKYILYLGAINAYKGLPILVDAVEKMQALPHQWKFVIAGSGKDECLKRVVNNNRFILINRFLQNSEVAELFSNASAVVCPYITMSQSGIPQTAFAFGTPVVASDLEGFKEVIVNGENGFLFETGNADSLLDCLNKIMNSSSVMHILKEGALKFSDIHHEYSWTYIAQQYERTFVRICQKYK